MVEPSMAVATAPPSLRELPQSLEWLNLARPPSLSALRGRVCVLAFVNAGSTWSQKVLADLAQWQSRHDGRLQVLAIDVPRFDHERDSRLAAQRFASHDYGIPVAHDRDWAAWQHYGIEAWPTLLLVDAEGELRARFVGDGHGHTLELRINELLADADPSAALLPLRTQVEPAMPLRFPGGLALSGKYLYVADTGHHRVLECDHAGRVLRQFGTGRAGFLDGAAETASFNRPLRLSAQHGSLYVADSGNHAIRRIDLRSGELVTLIGSGRPGAPVEGTVAEPRAVSLDHPRAMALTDDTLLIAGSGDNRIWEYDLGSRDLQLAAGSGELSVVDGVGEEAAFAEPVALAAVRQLVYVCDGAGSAIRSLNVRTRQVTTLLGRDGWHHGHADGTRIEALLQGPQAIALDPDAPLLWIADTGNNALRTLRLGGGQLETCKLSQPLHGPTGLAVADGVIWIADTLAHAVLRLDVRSGDLRHVPIGE
jgi:sugar lactone lactonase YvrE